MCDREREALASDMFGTGPSTTLDRVVATWGAVCSIQAQGRIQFTGHAWYIMQQIVCHAQLASERSINASESDPVHGGRRHTDIATPRVRLAHEH